MQTVQLRHLAADSLILTHFDPDCGYCELLAEDLESQAEHFRNYRFIWVAPRVGERLSAFQQEHPGDTDLDYHFLCDTANLLSKELGLKATPSLLVFHHGKKFIEVGGLTHAEALLPHP